MEDRYSSGGSGGKILLFFENLSGNGTISVKGGNSHESGISGEGAGGIINVIDNNSLKNYNLYNFNGIFDISKGARNISGVNGGNFEHFYG